MTGFGRPGHVKLYLRMSNVLLKHQYSSDIWPLKIKRNCIVDKSLAVRIVRIVDKLLAVYPTLYL